MPGALSIVIWFSSAAGNQDVDVELEQLLVGERLAAGEAGDGLVLLRRTSSSFGMSRPLAL